jgi:hypothetical protein
MSGPFPGMDPWLENSHIWQGVHNAFIVHAAEALQELIRPRFVAAAEARVYITPVVRDFVPDIVVRGGSDERSGGSAVLAVKSADEAIVLEYVREEVSESYIEIIDLESDQEVVTVIELLSRVNKVKGEGKELYREKQQEVLKSNASLVEIDLLRGGNHVLAVDQSEVAPIGVYDYLIAIHRSWDRAKRSYLYARTVRDRLPRIAIPLRSSDPPAILDLQAILDRVYDNGAFADRLNYAKPCVPRLRPDDEAWANERLQAWRAAQMPR